MSVLRSDSRAIRSLMRLTEGSLHDQESHPKGWRHAVRQARRVVTEEFMTKIIWVFSRRASAANQAWQLAHICSMTIRTEYTLPIIPTEQSITIDSVKVVTRISNKLTLQGRVSRSARVRGLSVASKASAQYPGRLHVGNTSGKSIRKTVSPLRSYR